MHMIVRSSTQNFTVYGKLGRFPLEVHIKLKMVCFWHRIASNENKLSGKLYKLLLHLSEHDNLILSGIVI